MSVTVHDRGTGPSRVVRYAPTVGTTVHVEHVRQVHWEDATGEVRSGSRVFEVVRSTVHGTDAGRFRLRHECVSQHTEPPSDRGIALPAVAELLVDASGDATLVPGLVSSAECDVDAYVAADRVPRFPDVAIGLGARWTVPTRSPVFGELHALLATFTVTRLTERHVQADCALASYARAPDGQRSVLGRGAIEVDLDTVVATGWRELYVTELSALWATEARVVTFVSGWL